MAKTFPTRPVILTVGLALAFGLAGRPAPAALDMVIGARNVVKNEPLSGCNTKARAALISVFGKTPAEYGDTGDWIGSGAVDASGDSYAAAAIHCYPLDTGYVVTFTCASQAPPAPENATVICTQLASAFGGQP